MPGWAYNHEGQLDEGRTLLTKIIKNRTMLPKVGKHYELQTPRQ